MGPISETTDAILLPTPAPYVPMSTLVVGLLLGHTLRVLLLRAQEVANPSERIGGEDEAGGDDSLSTSHHAVSAALLVLAAIGVQRVILTLTRKTDGEEGVVQHGSLDLGCVLLDDGEGLVDFAQSTFGDGVGLCNDRSDETVRLLCVWKNGLDESLEAIVGELNRFFAVRVTLECGDGVADDRVRCEMLVGWLAWTSNRKGK